MVPVAFYIFLLSDTHRNRNWRGCLSTTDSMLPTLPLGATLLPTALLCVLSGSGCLPSPTSLAGDRSRAWALTQVWPIRVLSPGNVNCPERDNPLFFSLVKLWDVGLEASGDPAGMEGIYKEGIRLKSLMRHRGIVLVASEDLFLIPRLHGFALAFCTLILHLVL